MESELQKILNAEKKKTCDRLVAEFQRKVDIAADFAKKKAVEKYRTELKAEKENLFDNTVDNNEDPYFYVKDFYDRFLTPVLGLQNSFDEELQQAKQNILKTYAKNAYLTNIQLFLSQEDHVLAKKFGCYLGYEEALKMIDSVIVTRISKGSAIKEEFKEVFVSPEIYDQVLHKIKKYGIVYDNTWAGIYKGFKQEIPALVDVWIENGYVKREYSRLKVIKRLINFYHINFDYTKSSLRTKTGYAYLKALSGFENVFPRL